MASTTLSAAEVELFKPLSNADCWSKLPAVEKGADQPLPVWARQLAGSLPRTTAALLQLDYAHRTRSPLDPKLRALARWVAAQANGSAYGKAEAAADFRRAGGDAALLDELSAGDFSKIPAADKAALDFVRKMTVDSAGVTDAEFASLVAAVGPKKVAALVLLSAYANFEDRLLLCLATPVDANGPAPAVDVVFAQGALTARTTAPAPSKKEATPEPKGDGRIADAGDWTALTYETLQGRLSKQRTRSTRLPVPDWKDVEAGLPKGLFNRPSPIVWNRVCLGYVPELAIPWELVLRTSGAETMGKWDRVFSVSLFWVTTRAIQCPYCMGHCEMNWEVAGLTKDQIARRSKLLAGDDWSSFAPAEQRAFAFARTVTSSPKAIRPADVNELQKDFGREKAAIIAFSACRNNYMTRISNGFQLTLETDNVFYDYYDLKSPAEKKPVDAVAVVEIPSDEQAWKMLPERSAGGTGPLPTWAKAFAPKLPRTAAAMLELDLAQRTKSPLDPILRAKMRWAIANANRCAYSEATALADLRRAGADADAVKVLTGPATDRPEADREPLEFARLLTVAAPTIPDELFARLRERFGDKGVASMVLLGAYGNYQDRIILGLNLPLESGGPLPPVEVKFAPGVLRTTTTTPPSRTAAKGGAAEKTVVERDPEWSELSYEELQKRLEGQRRREPRLPVPAWDVAKRNFPAELSNRPSRIAWTLVCVGYAPELALPWMTATRTMMAEAGQDRIFEESLFWIQTRSIKCNYCMGHTEMLLEQAGLDKQAVADRTRRLASDDWSSFPAAEQRSYAYARKLSKTPWSLTKSDYQTLADDLGPDQALATFWWLCRGLYMTRVSDGFQLPLERDNVFADYFPKSATR